MGRTKASTAVKEKIKDTEIQSEKSGSTNQVSNLRYSITKSNRLIQAQYKCSVLEEKIVYAALYAAQNKSFVETDEGYEVIISPNELREMTGYKGGSFYSKLQPAAQALTQRVYGIEDPENDRFEYINLISRSVYDKGEFKITFNRTQRNLILNLTTNFTQLPVLMMKLKNVYAFRLYELLRSECYYKKNTPKAERTNTFFLSHSISELKLALGVVDASERDVRKVLSSKTPDYDMAVAKAKDSMYSVNGNFTRDVIAKAVKEINTKLDMKIEYKTRKRGSQLHDVEFVVTMEDKKKESDDEGVKLNEAELFEFHSKVLKLFDCKLGYSEVPLISRKSGYDMQKLIRIRNIMDDSKVVINNIAGFILKALEDNYQVNKAESEKKSTDKDSEIYNQAKELLQDKFKDEDIVSILDAANNDMEKIRKAKGILDGKKRVKSAVGFMIAAIKKDYEEVESIGTRERALQGVRHEDEAFEEAINNRTSKRLPFA